MITDDLLREAIDRIGRTADGELLYLYLQRFLCRVTHSADAGALQAENGKRIFAQELMGLMSRGLSEIHAGTRNDRIAIFAVPEPRSIRQPGASRRGPAGQPGFESEFDDDGPPGMGTREVLGRKQKRASRRGPA
jgi:hypothetical protein